MIIKKCYKKKERKTTKGFLEDVEFIPEFKWQLGLSQKQAQLRKVEKELPAAL